jgi:gliding motility-associated-like protein
MVRYPLLLFVALLLSFPTWGQAGSDCTTAQSVCNEQYEESNSPAGTGALFEVAPNTCQSIGEFNSAWYVFTVQENGMLNFTLQPNSNADDYDWSLFNITENGCAGINSGASPEVHCNSWGTFGNQGPTGISSANGGAGTSNGPGDTNGPPFNQDLNVTEGQVFALVIMNFSATLNGYDLDFGSSTASIFDNEPPIFVSAVANCDQSELTITLSENVGVEQLIAGNIELVNNGNVFPIANIDVGNGEYTNSFTVSAALLPNCLGEVSLQFNVPPSDLCGNALPASFSFTLDGPFTTSFEVESSCQGQGGSIEVNASGLDGSCFDFFVNSVQQNNASCEQWTTLTAAAGAYTIEVTSINGACTNVLNVEVEDVPISLFAGENVVLCDLQTTLAAEVEAEGFQWLPVAGLTFSQPNQPNSQVTALTNGPVILVAQAETAGCIITDEVQITFNFPPELDWTTTAETCFGNCDGSVEWVNPNTNDLTVAIGTFEQTGNPIQFSALCQGTYEAQVVFSPSCIASYTFTINGQPEVVAAFDAQPWVTTVNETEITLNNLSTNADSVFWEIAEVDSSRLNNWTVLLPAMAGNYPVELTAYGANGCFDKTEAILVVRDEFQFFLPNSFSPNNDGINDYFRAYFSYSPELYELSIFDRWGERVFFSTQPEEVWMGQKSAGDHYLPTDVYVWQLKVKGLSTEISTLTGTVTPVR